MRRFAPVVLAVALLLSVLVPAAGGRAFAATAHPSQPVAAKVQASHCGIFRKADIVLHLGIAYVAFKHWLYTPYKEGKFKKGASGRAKTIVKAVIAALVGVHELHVALTKANNCGAGAKMQSLLNTITGKANSLKSGANSASDSAVGSDINGMNGAWNQINALKSGL